jgi:CheY-like chemotaxis protein
VVAALKNQPQTRSLPVVILSIVEDRERGYQLGVDRYLTKPIEVAVLLREIEMLLDPSSVGKTVLIADSSSQSLSQLREVLEAQDYTISEVTDAPQLWHKALTERPTLIVAHVQIANPPMIAKLHSEGFTRNILLYE